MFGSMQGLPNIIKSGDERDRNDDWGWIFALVIIFLVVVFFAAIFMKKDRREDHVTDLAPLAAVAAMNAQPKHVQAYDWGDLSHREHWDIERDTMMQFGNLKYEGALNSWKLSAEAAQRHAESLRNQDQIRYDLASKEDAHFAILDKSQAVDTRLIIEKQQESTAAILAKLASDRESQLKEELARERGENVYLRTTRDLRPQPIHPSYPVCPPTHMPFGGYTCPA